MQTPTPHINPAPSLAEEFTPWSWVSNHASWKGGALAFVEKDLAFTWKEFARRVIDLSAGLIDRDVQLGDRVAIHAPNSVDYLATMVACSRVGAIATPINYRLSNRELETIFSDCEPLLVIGQREGHDFVGYDELAMPGAFAEPALPVARHNDAILVYTSGSTGAPKGVPLTYENLWWNHHQFRTCLPLAPHDCVLAVAPFFHVAGLNVMTFPALMMGLPTLVLERFDAAAVAMELSTRTSCTFMVPQMWQKVMEQDVSFAAARFGVTGGAPSWAGLFESADRVGIQLYEGYGMTEAAPMVSIASPRDRGTVGRPGPQVEVKIVDEYGLELPPGEPGEILVNGPNVMRKYWRRPLEISRFGVGWHRTSDVGLVDTRGRLVLKGRIDDMIITGGENVHPAEVERVLRQHPNVDEICVFGIDDDEWGEKVVAAVVSGFEVDASELAHWAEGQIGRFKLPRDVLHLHEMPVTGSGKVDRTEVKKMWGHFER